jgi:hypothetical protein
MPENAINQTAEKSYNNRVNTDAGIAVFLFHFKVLFPARVTHGVSYNKWIQKYYYPSIGIGFGPTE